MLPSSFSVLSEEQQALHWDRLLNVFINDLCAEIIITNILLFAADLRIFHIKTTLPDYIPMLYMLLAFSRTK
jgi:hypothetical protein